MTLDLGVLVMRWTAQRCSTLKPKRNRPSRAKPPSETRFLLLSLIGRDAVRAKDIAKLVEMPESAVSRDLKQLYLDGHLIMTCGKPVTYAKAKKK